MEADAALAELELLKAKRELISADDVKAAWADVLSAMKAKMMALPTICAPMCAVETEINVIQNILEGQVTEALDELSAYRPQEHAGRTVSSDSGSDGGSKAATKAKRGRVGRPRERRLSSEASAEAGKWHTARANYQRGIMDAISDPRNRDVVVMAGAQVGKTEMILNVIGYHIAHDPSPILVVQPTLDMAQAFSKDRLAPMLRDTPQLRGKVKDPRARDANNTTTHKVFPGGHISLVGSNSPSGLASRPIRIVLCDEVDRLSGKRRQRR